MKFYLAPLEGITKVKYRNLFYKYFPNIDKLYIPFIEPTGSRVLSAKDLKEMPKERNKETFHILVPQIISKNAQDTIFLINEAKKMGYKEINLNFGCPSPTVTTKGKGAGMLKNPIIMDRYLKEIFDNCQDILISIKMRIGFSSENEFTDLIKIINKYNVNELIIHPRTANEKYSGLPHLNVLDNLDKLTNIPIIYNGDISSKKDIEYIENRYPFLKGLMIGRGLIAKPFLLSNYQEDEIREKLYYFYHELISDAIKDMGWGNAKYYAKEIWALMQKSYVIPPNLLKKSFKQEKEKDFFEVINQIMNSCPIDVSDELSLSFIK